jgi:hypothetical protein
MHDLDQRARADAAGLRRVAAVYRSRGDRIGDVERRVSSQLATLTFDGPAGAQFRREMDAERQRLAKLRVTLGELANTLARMATELESDPVAGYAGLRGHRP